MAIIDTNCECSEKVTVKTGVDSNSRTRRDGKQVIYTGEEFRFGNREYNIFRCRKCHEPIGETCPEAAF